MVARHPAVASASLALATLVALVACAGEPVQPAPRAGDLPPVTGPPVPPPPDTVRPQLVDLGVTFASYDAATGRAGAFDFRLRNWSGSPLGPYGRTVLDATGARKHLPEFGYFVPAGTVVRAVFDGVVNWVEYQADAKDYEVMVRRTKNSVWWYDYDHLDTVFVTAGATVRAGEPVGIVRNYGNGVGFVELMVGSDRPDSNYCPLSLAAPAKADSLANAVRRLLADWRALGNAQPDTSGMIIPGCYARSLPGG